MKHASTRGAVRIAATPAANASRRAVRRVAASAVTLLALYAHAAGAQQNPWTSVSSARCPRPPAISARTSATPSCWPSRKAAASSAGCRSTCASRMTRLPANAKQSADRMVQSGVRLFTGVNFSNVLAAVAPAVLNAGGFYVSLNAAPSNYAGRACNPNYFSVAFQNDSYADTAGMAANDLGARRVVVMAPNYQAGRDAVAGFKRAYKGEIVEEIYTKLDQSDFRWNWRASARWIRTRCSSSIPAARAST